jgi:thiosulfate/3-mercaptopyruvate sulfurtransferase
MPVYNNLISATELTKILDECAVFDCRAQLGDINWGRQAYFQGHIAGAHFADLDVDLADPPGSAGRHPLPDIARWRQWAGKMGLTENLQVVVYDDSSGAYAARAWWMLRWLGHANVAVLDGGLSQWPGELQSDVPAAPAAGSYPERASLTRMISSIELHQQLNRLAPNQLIDARTQPRWAGEAEPIDPIAGHIPGAVCMPFQDNLNSDGCFKSAAELAARFAELAANPICYCGSGVTAAHNVLAMHVAGMTEPTLYADSWSGWITDPTRPIAKAI